MKPPHIRFYISDYGYGHASRSIALIRALQKEFPVIISIRTKTSAYFLERSLPSCSISQKQNDCGTVMYKDSLRVNHFETELQLKSSTNSWGEFIEEECKFCQENGVDLIISDITPQAFLVAEVLGIPGIAFSNFSWELIFRNLYGTSSEVEQMKEAYRLADLTLVLPFHEPMNCFRNKVYVPLVSRKPTRSRQAIRERLGIQNEDTLVFLSSGLSVNTVPNCIEKLVNSGIHVLVSESFNITRTGVFSIPSTEVETQDYLEACDLVITKPGYSTVSEAVSAKIPLLMYGRDGFAEDSYIIDPILKNRVGQTLTYDEVVEGEWINTISSLYSLKTNYSSCSDTFMMDGTDICIQHIGSYL